MEIVTGFESINSDGEIGIGISAPRSRGIIQRWLATTRVIVPMQPSESAVTICKIMVGLRVQPEETSARNDVQSAFLGLGSERTPEEFGDGVTYAVAQDWVMEGDGDTLKISRTGFLVGSS